MWAFQQQSQSRFKWKNRGHFNNNSVNFKRKKCGHFNNNLSHVLNGKIVGISTTTSFYRKNRGHFPTRVNFKNG
jgi:hypothetical protein